MLLKGNGGRGDNEPFALRLGYGQPCNEISQRLARAGGSDAGSIAQEEIARLAVVRGRAAGDDFADGEVIRLAEQLLRCRNPLTCPQGRPTYFEHPWREWKKRFGRTL